MEERTSLYRPIIGVMCGSGSIFPLAEELAEAIAVREWNLLTGGGGGTMQAVTNSYNRFKKSHCRSIAVRPKGRGNTANADVLIDSGVEFGTHWDDKEHLVGDSRNHLNVRIADVVVALPGMYGTQSELDLAVQHGKPCIAFLPCDGDRIGNLEREGRAIPDLGVEVARTIEEVERFLEANVPSIGPVAKGAPSGRSETTIAVVSRKAEKPEFDTPEGCMIHESWNELADGAVSIAQATVSRGERTQLHRLLGVTERYLVISGEGIAQVGDQSEIAVWPGDVLYIGQGVPQRIQASSVDDLVFYCVCTPRFRPDCYEALE